MEISRRVDSHIDPRVQPSPARTQRTRESGGDEAPRVDRDAAHVGRSGDSVHISAQATARLDSAAAGSGPSALDADSAAAAAHSLAAALADEPQQAFGAQGNLSSDAVLRLLA